MTPFEVISVIRLLLDDSIDYQFIKSNLVSLNSIVNESQSQIISEAYNSQDEQCLRPLYKILNNVKSGMAISDMLYPRGCSIYPDSTFIPRIPFSGIFAKYVEYSVYLNNDSPTIGPSIQQPTGATWTITDNLNILYTSRTGLEIADVCYIMQPAQFNFNTSNIPSSIGLSVPNEYHYKICAHAAHLINIRDVNEYQREADEFNGAKLNYENMNL